MSLLNDLKYTQKCVKDTRQEERERLRPLLERCLAEIGRHVDPYCNHQSLGSSTLADELLADLRRELEKP